MNFAPQNSFSVPARIMATLLFVLALGQAWAQESSGLAAPEIPLPDAVAKTVYVEDLAGALKKPDRETLEALLSEKAKNDRLSIKIVLLEKADRPLEELAEDFLQAWRSGRDEDKEEAIVFLIVVKEQKSHIATVYSLESVLPASQRLRITRQFINPALKKAQVSEAINTGLDWIERIASGQRLEEKQWRNENIILEFAYWDEIFNLTRILCLLLGLFLLFKQNYRAAVIYPSLAFIFIAVSMGTGVNRAYIGQLMALPGYYILCISVWLIYGSESLKIADKNSPGHGTSPVRVRI